EYEGEGVIALANDGFMEWGDGFDA
ncbi:MAG: hypothetical protein JWP03_1579, partial [Phycisphaerales bacterium]|nr:hypothetical protein [Phycisphaerales bacterium]